jgi:eukaryotic-like serine/threonine-protein kinase
MTLDRLSLDVLIDGLNRLEAEALRQEIEPKPKPLGRFKVRGQLGSGRFAIVALADDPVLGRQVALKLPRPELLADERMRNRFIREAQAAARLDHEGIVPVLDVVQPGESIVYLVLGLVNGPNLEEWLEKNLVVDEKLGCQLAAIADAVQHAHDRKVLHLDLKPSNILIDPGHGPVPGVGRPRVTDFGLARVFDRARRRTTALFAGTPGFMAPEQFGESSLKVSERTDVWAIGAILFQVLTGRPPFEGSEPEMALRVLTENPPTPRSLRPDLSLEVSAIVMKCLQIKPDRRYASARGLADDLRAVLQGKPPSLPKKNVRRRAMWCISVASAIVIFICVIAFWPRSESLDGTAQALQPPAEQWEAWMIGPPARPVPKPTRPHFINSSGMAMIRIEPGEFDIGSPENEAGRKDDEVRCHVKIIQPFYLGQCEVTVAQFREFVREKLHVTDAERPISPDDIKEGRGGGGRGVDPRSGAIFWGPFTWDRYGAPYGDDYPVVNVSWNDAMAFCDWLSQKDGRRYSLPTEAEWEYACRAGTTTAFSFGNDAKELPKHGNANGFDFRADNSQAIDAYPFLAPVGQFPPNAFGLHDMQGNAGEWCFDTYGSYLEFPDLTDPVQRAAGRVKVLRGGCWGTPP